MSPAVAFVDESRRAQTYLLASVTIDIRRLDETRRVLRSLVRPPRRRLHFNGEPNERRRELLRAIDQLPITATVQRAVIAHDVREHTVRAALLAQLVADLQRQHVANLVIESRETADRFDRAVIERARQLEPPLTYEHRSPNEEPLLWLPDAFAWAVGAGTAWTSLLTTTWRP